MFEVYAEEYYVVNEDLEIIDSLSQEEVELLCRIRSLSADGAIDIDKLFEMECEE